MTHPWTWRIVSPTLFLLVAGCGGNGSISGRVTFHGDPLPTGAICFHSEEGNRDVFNAPIKNGEFTIDALPAGAARVTVVTVDPSGSARGDLGPRQPQPRPGAFVPIPRRYGNPETSGLTWTVKPGPQRYEVDLTP
jgi:hypothetical protein